MLKPLLLIVAIATLTCLPVRTVAAQLAFSETSYPVGGTPSALVAGDFNNDGAVDLLVTLSDIAAVQVLLGNAGAFVPGAMIPVGVNPIDIVATDFNNDGNLDFATADNDSSGPLVGFATISIRLGNGLGGFTNAPPLDAFICRSLTTGDFNGDGNADLAAQRGSGHPGSNDFVWLYLGDGLGNFQVNAQYSLGIDVQDVHAVRVNNDAFLDLVVTCTGMFASGVFTVMGDGTGGFNVPIANPLMEPYTTSAIGDFDGNGSLDLVANHPGTSPCLDTIDIVSGDGAGGFSVSSTLTLPCGEHSFAVADWNGDGDSDVAITRPASPLSPTVTGVVTLALSDSVGGFVTQDVAVGQTPAGILTDDLDGNGQADLVIGDSGTHSIRVLLGGGPATADPFVRGDANSSGTVGIDDPITILQYLFVPGAAVPACLDAADFDDSGTIVLNDPIAILGYLFNSGAPPQLPFPACGFDVTSSTLLECSYPQVACP